MSAALCHRFQAQRQNRNSPNYHDSIFVLTQGSGTRRHTDAPRNTQQHTNKTPQTTHHELSADSILSSAQWVALRTLPIANGKVRKDSIFSGYSSSDSDLTMWVQQMQAAGKEMGVGPSLGRTSQPSPSLATQLGGGNLALSNKFVRWASLPLC